MKALSRYEVTGNKIHVYAGYADDIVSTCRKWGGKWEKDHWSVALTRLSDVQDMIGKNQNDLVEVEVGKADLSEKSSQYLVGWFVLASRRGRDSRADIYADLVQGEIPDSGGSMKYPLVEASDDARFSLWVPRDFAITRKLIITTDPQTTVDPKAVAVAQIKALMTEFGITVADLT